MEELSRFLVSPATLLPKDQMATGWSTSLVLKPLFKIHPETTKLASSTLQPHLRSQFQRLLKHQFNLSLQVKKELLEGSTCRCLLSEVWESTL